MAIYSDIKGAAELVEKYKDEFTTINDSIKQLEERKAKLQEQLDSSKERFTLESIEKNANTKRDLNLVNQYLSEAKEQRAKLEKEIAPKAYEEARAVLSEHREVAWKKADHINKQIIEHLYIIRDLHKEQQAIDQEEQRKVRVFVNDLMPYLEDEETFRRKNGGQSPHHTLRAQAFHNRKNIVGSVPEKAYGVAGLLQFDSEIRGSIVGRAPQPKELNERYNVDVEKAKKQAEKLVNKK